MWQKILVAKRKQSHQIFQSQRVVEGSGMEIAQQQIKGLGGGIFYNHLSGSPFLPILQGFLKVFEPRKHRKQAGAPCPIFRRKLESDNALHIISVETGSNPSLGDVGICSRTCYRCFSTITTISKMHSCLPFAASNPKKKLL